jgi:hypothetical protein
VLKAMLDTTPGDSFTFHEYDELLSPRPTIIDQTHMNSRYNEAAE